MILTNQKQLFIPVILGTAREGRLSLHVANFIHRELSERGDVTTELIDVADFTFPRTIKDSEVNDTAERWRAIASRADGYVIVTPEYNRGIPGELKQLLDCAYSEYEKKPVGLVGVSDGRFGGTAAITNITPTLVELGLVVLRGAMRVANVDTLFDEKNNLKEPELYRKLATKLFETIVWYARALKEARSK